MLPAALHDALPGIRRRAAFPVTRCPPDPRLSPGHRWPIGERPHVSALAHDRGPVHHLTTGAHKNPSTKGES